uniref:DDT domain-containing protein n=1 Tax=Caenorhabditis tropicalis TaxID=1561998 RepID=A0A1I7TAE5_9PELO
MMSSTRPRRNANSRMTPYSVEHSTRRRRALRDVKQNEDEVNAIVNGILKKASDDMSTVKHWPAIKHKKSKTVFDDTKENDQPEERPTRPSRNTNNLIINDHDYASSYCEFLGMEYFDGGVKMTPEGNTYVKILESHVNILLRRDVLHDLLTNPEKLKTM